MDLWVWLMLNGGGDLVDPNPPEPKGFEKKNTFICINNPCPTLPTFPLNIQFESFVLHTGAKLTFWPKISSLSFEFSRQK